MDVTLDYYFLDLETCLISDDDPYPKPICLSWISGDELNQGVAGNNLIDINGEKISCLERMITNLLHRCNEGEFKIVWHNGMNFDIPVLLTHLPALEEVIIRILDKGFFQDTLIREKLYDLSTTGRIKNKGYSLMTLAKTYLGVDVAKYKEGEDIWRLRYSELDGIPSINYPKEAIEYCLLDVKILKEVFLKQETIRQAFGIGSMNTEALQIKSAIALNDATNYGIIVNEKKLNEFESTIDQKLKPLQDELVKKGFAKYTKTGKFTKENKKFIEYLETTYPEYIEKTDPTDTHPQGQTRVDEEALSLFPLDNIIEIRKNLSLLEKYKNTYCKNIRKAKGIFKSSYDILKETGRTSSFIQTMPREGGVRELFKGRPGKYILTIDYAALEACSIAQTMKNLGLGTTLLDYLNEGDSPNDYHCILGHLWHAHSYCYKPNIDYFKSLIKSGDNEAKKSRNDSKAGGLSIAGGVGNTTMVAIAKGSGIKLTEQDAQIFREFAFTSMPEIRSFLGDGGWMGKQKLSGDYTYPYAYEVNGRYRNRCTYCSCANGKSMQSLAADGAKEAIWRCYKTCKHQPNIKLLAFIHDELIFEIPYESPEEMKRIAENLCYSMCAGMRTVMPDVRITTEWSIMKYWTKDSSKHLLNGKYWVG